MGDALPKKILEIGGIGTWELEVSTGALRWSRETYGIFGVPVDTAMDIDGFFSLVHEEDIEKVKHAWEMALSGEDYEIEHRIHRGGDVLWVREKGLVVYAKDRTPTSAIGLVQDISAERTVHEDLAISRARLLRAQEITRIGNWEYDIVQGTIWGSEGAFRIYGFERTTPYLRLEDIHRITVDPEHNTAALKALIVENAPYDIEFEITPAYSEKPVVIHSKAELVRNAHGQPVKVVGVIQDITHVKETERRRIALEQQLQHTQKMEAIGRLAGGIAHDFNNLLYAITGNVELAIVEPGVSEPVLEYLMDVKRAAEVAANLTRQLLTFTRRQVVRPEHMELSVVFRNLMKMIQRLIGPEIRLVTRFEEQPWLVKVDPGQIEQIFLNLAINAKDAMVGGGELTIVTQNISAAPGQVSIGGGSLEGDIVVLTVRDTGIGMSEEVRQRIFEPFFTTKEMGRGTGLGLATVFGIMEQNGGHIAVESEPGRGTSFTLYFPRNENPEDAVEAEAPETSEPGRETILLVEDDEIVRRLGEKIFRSQGYAVYVAQDGKEALDLFDAHGEEVDLLFTDLMMPNMDGRELAGVLLQRTPDIGVIYTSGHMDNMLADGGVLESGIHFIAKPYVVKDLLSLVRDVLASRPKIGRR